MMITIAAIIIIMIIIIMVALFWPPMTTISNGAGSRERAGHSIEASFH